MKVSELRELLNKLDGDLDVVTEAIIQEECGYVDVIGTDTIMLLDDCGKSSRAIVIKTRRYYVNKR